MSVTKRLYGTMPDGREVFEYTLDNNNGLCVKVLNYGGIITQLLVKDKDGKMTDVVLGRNNLEEYLDNDGYLGAAIGRYGNRLSNAKFTLNGKEYNVGMNNGKNSLHGGIIGFDKKIWDVEEKDDGTGIILRYTSVDGEEGFPGNLKVKMKYSLTKENGLKLDYTAVCDKDTVCNLTNHSYFNLSGHDSGEITNQICQMNVSFYTPNNDECMPTGEIASVSGTPFDFRVPKPFGQDINSDFPQTKMFGGYDHNMVIDGRGLRKAAIVQSLETGITMEVYTNQPGVQLYTANALDEGTYKNGASYGKHNAFCLETQSFPNAMEHAHFPGPVLKKGEIYSHITEYRFV